MHYILQIVVLQIIFLFVYELFLKQETFYRWNRLYLISTSLLAIVLPKIQFSALENVVPADYIYILPTVTLGSTTTNVVADATTTLATNPIATIELIYLLGLALALLFFLKKLLSLILLLRKSKHIKHKQYTIVLLTEKQTAFSFLRYIFIHEALFNTNELQVIAHEQIHVKQKHSWDLLFFELQKIIFWFNPAVYLYQKRITEVHEFLTDDLIIKQIDKRTYFNLLLNEVFSTENITFANQFYNYSLIKKRIIMATKNKSKKVRLAKYLLLIPVLTMTLIYTSCNKDSVSKNDISENTESTSHKQIKNTTSDSEANHKSYKQEKTVLFRELSKAPILPGCEQSEHLRDCFTEHLHQFVRDNFNYPEAAKKQGIAGRVYVSFIIDSNGKVAKIKARGPDPILENEAKRIIGSLPKMVPGEVNGKPVAMTMALPIAFKMAE